MSLPNGVSIARVVVALAVALTSATTRAADDASLPAPSLSEAVAQWAVLQLVPSPLLVTGDHHVGGGLRWQLTPLLYSFGIAEGPWRSFLVAPLARQSGSIELHLLPEWACCASDDRTSWVLRGGVRAYLPLLEHGQKLQWSLGGSYYRAAGGGGWSVDAGLYTFSGIFGLNVTLSPALSARQVVSALTLRYF